MKTKTFLISPVRGVPASQYQALVERLEENFDVYWPVRDTDQTDRIGLTTCQDNLEAMKKADVVHVIWNGKSQGSLFDLGMAFALDKDIVPLELPSPVSGKSFQGMIIEWTNKRPPIQTSKPKPKHKTTVKPYPVETQTDNDSSQEVPDVKPTTKESTKSKGSLNLNSS